MSNVKTGACLCGAVRFVARDVPSRVIVCHCQQCQRWLGSALFEVSVPESLVTWEGDLRRYASSDWAERAFCPTCGTGLFMRVTDGGDWSGEYNIPLGLFDDTSGFEVTHEVFEDQAVIALKDAGQKRLSRADCVAINPKLEERADG